MELERTKSLPGPRSVIEENHEIDHQYFGDQKSSATTMAMETPLRSPTEFERSPSPNAMGYSDAEEDAMHVIENLNALSFGMNSKAKSVDYVGCAPMTVGRKETLTESRHKIIKTADEKTLQEMQSM